MEALIISLIVVSLYFTHKWFFRKGFHAAVDLIQDTMTKDSEAQPCWLTENCQGLLHYTSGRSICNLCNKFYKVPE
tara:strand:- start:12310 stop:12537 length:228 start_codon:yes stop_codon:yes gene_type:complete